MIFKGLIINCFLCKYKWKWNENNNENMKYCAPVKALFQYERWGCLNAIWYHIPCIEIIKAFEYYLYTIKFFVLFYLCFYHHTFLICFTLTNEFFKTLCKIFKSTGKQNFLMKVVSTAKRKQKNKKKRRKQCTIFLKKN